GITQHHPAKNNRKRNGGKGITQHHLRSHRPNEKTPSDASDLYTLLRSRAYDDASPVESFLGFRSYQTMSFVFSGILTPIPAFGFLFDNIEVKGPVIQYLIRPEECLKRFHPIDLEKLQFVGDSLKILRQEVEEHAKGSSSADVIGLDWTVDMADGKRRLGSSVRDLRVHGNVDPSNLLSLIPALTEEIYRWIVYFVELKHILKPRTRCLGRDVRGSPSSFLRNCEELGLRNTFPFSCSSYRF
ncbi:hypothetical protein F2Q70_00006454, partial [Brassica cretica]